MGLRSLIALHSGRYTASISCSRGPKSSSANCSLLRACLSQLFAAAATTHLWPSAPCLIFRQGDHSSEHCCLETAYTLVCFRPWWCSDGKLYSCRRWTRRAVCLTRILKFSSKLKAEFSVRGWISCPFKYLWKCSRVFIVDSNSRRSNSSSSRSWTECCLSKLQPVRFHILLVTVLHQISRWQRRCRQWTSLLFTGSPGQVPHTQPLLVFGKLFLIPVTNRMSIFLRLVLSGA